MSTSPPTRRSSVLANRSSSLVFLCYHSINDTATSHSVTPNRFERQLATLRAVGYGAASQQTLTELVTGRPPGGRLALLTFDDGFRDTYTDALPILQAYGFGALVFVLPTLVDRAAAFTWPEVAAETRRHPEVFRSLSWPEIGLMREAGVEVGSHTCRHGLLTTLDDEELRQELLDSRRRIEAEVGHCQSIAYPYGACNRAVIAAARAAGYRFGFSLPYGAIGVGWQRGYDEMRIPRVALHDHDDERRVRMKLTPGGRRVLLSPAMRGLRYVNRWR
jgi:peptidoglycan/xylan/chitin deacetylase (PgdA/CDA1 family)